VEQFSVRECVSLLALFRLCEALFRPQETLRPLRGQPVAVLVQVYQRGGRTQPFMVFLDAPVTILGNAEDTLQDAKRMLDFGSHAGLGRGLALGLFIYMILVFGAAASYILCLRRGRAIRLCLALIAAIAPYLAFVAMQ
jgi:hypothetical protein